MGGVRTELTNIFTSIFSQLNVGRFLFPSPNRIRTDRDEQNETLLPDYMLQTNGYPYSKTSPKRAGKVLFLISGKPRHVLTCIRRSLDVGDAAGTAAVVAAYYRFLVYAPTCTSHKLTRSAEQAFDAVVRKISSDGWLTQVGLRLFVPVSHLGNVGQQLRWSL